MFNLMSFATAKNAESGILGSTLVSIRALLTHLLHSPETGVVTLTVGAGYGPIPYGYLVGIIAGNKKTCRKSSRGEEGIPFDGYTTGSVNIIPPKLTPKAKAVCLHRATGGLASSATGYFRMTGVADVAMVPGLILNTGNRVFVSATQGLGTNVPFVGSNRQVGWILDTTGYAQTGLVKVLLDWDDYVVSATGQ